MATETNTQAPSDETGLTQTLIWLGAMMVGVVVVGYFYI